MPLQQIVSADGTMQHCVPDLSGVRSTSGRGPVRVLVSTPSMSSRGGVSQYWRILRLHLPDDVRYFTIGSRSENNWIATPLRLLQDSWRFAEKLRRGKFDMVHLNPSIFPKSLIRDGILLLLAKALGKEVLVFAHGWNPAWNGRFPKYFPNAFRAVYGRADVFVVLGERFKEQLQLLGFEKRIFVERAPVADDLLKAADYEPAQRCSAPNSHFNILFLARVERDKGIYEALDAYQMLKQRHRFISLTVAGDGSEFNAARQYARVHKLHDVSFVGHVEGTEKVSAFRMANAYLFPSHHEGLPLSVLEAMAFGLPIVTRDVGALRDFFAEGTMGFITASQDPKVLASLLHRLICDPMLCSDIRDFNRKYARTNFTGSQIATRLERIYSATILRQ